jgi:hypothetical protein
MPDGRPRSKTLSLRDINPKAGAEQLAALVRAVAPLLAGEIERVTRVTRYELEMEASGKVKISGLAGVRKPRRGRNGRISRKPVEARLTADIRIPVSKALAGFIRSGNFTALLEAVSESLAGAGLSISLAGRDLRRASKDPAGAPVPCAG